MDRRCMGSIPHSACLILKAEKQNLLLASGTLVIQLISALLQFSVPGFGLIRLWAFSAFRRTNKGWSYGRQVHRHTVGQAAGR